MRAAGIQYTQRKRKIKGMDYSIEVPLQRYVPQGSNDVQSEVDLLKDIKVDPRITLRQLEGGRRDQEEAKSKKKDDERMKEMKKKNLPKAMEIIARMNDPKMLNISSKLVLSAPKISYEEINTIAKMGAGQNSKSSSATGVLVGQMSTR